MSVIVNPPNPANKVVVTPPSGGNLVTVLAGIAGPTGPTGATGPANSLDVLSTTTGTPGSDAHVTISGTSPHQSLAFTIPSGLKGDTGATGSKGDTGNTGATGTTPTLSVNSTVGTLVSGNTGIASIGGTLPNNPKLYLTLPAGPTGSTGATGASNTLSIGGTTTGAAGTNAVASLSGTSPSQTLYFTIPAGVKGDTGNTGSTGATGATPTLSVNSTVATLGYGNNGIASIGGTLPNNPKLYLTLPAGPQGPVGTEANALVSTYGDNLKLTFNSNGYIPAVLYSGNAESITLPSVSGQLITEAPSDGNQYARKDAGWVTVSGGGGSYNQLTNGSYSVVLDSLGNTTFPNATVESSGLVVSQGVGSYDTIGVGSTGSLGYGLNNSAINPDGSASFANGTAHINADGTASFYGFSTDGHVVTMGDTTGYIKGGNLYGAPSFELWDGNGRAAYFYAGSSNSGLFDARSVSTNFGITINPDVSINFGNYPSGVAYINSDGSAAFASGNASIDPSGNATFAGSITTSPQSAPSFPVAGQIYFDSGDSHFYGYNGTSWVQLDN